MSSETERLVAELPPELKRMVDADGRTNKEVVEAALWKEFGGKRKGLVDIQIEHKQDQLKSVTDERDELDGEAKRLRQEIEALQATREEIESGATYREELLALLHELEDSGGHIWPDHNEIADLAKQEDKEATDVIDDARELAADEELSLLTTQFVRAGNAQYIDEQPITEAVDDE